MDKYLIANDKGKPRVFRVSQLEQFTELATWLYSNDNVLFRGQTFDWSLLPAIGRNPRSKDYAADERKVVAEFKREALPYLDFLPRNDWQWLAVAQHNRLPTRFLDWTRNPLVALWFAVSVPAMNASAGIVWAYCYERDDVIDSTDTLDRSPFEVESTQVYFPEHIFRYFEAQSGAFTVHHWTEDPGMFVPLEACQDSDYRLTKVEITSDSFASLRYHLFRIGINPATLFPGVSGLVSRIRYEREPCHDEHDT